MLQIAVIEDDAASLRCFQDYIKQYSAETGAKMILESFDNGFDFLDRLTDTDFNIVFLDIKLPLMDGFKIAEKIREKSQIASIIFLTNMAKYAVRGYEYDAVAYLVKPLSYIDLRIKLNKAIAIQDHLQHSSVVVQGKDGIHKMNYDDIYYVESNKHYIIYHTVSGDIVSRDSISSVELRLVKQSFFRIHKSFIVNLQHIDGITGMFCQVKSSKVPISSKYKGALMKKIAEYWGGDFS